MPEKTQVWRIDTRSGKHVEVLVHDILQLQHGQRAANARQNKQTRNAWQSPACSPHGVNKPAKLGATGDQIFIRRKGVIGGVNAHPRCDPPIRCGM